MSEPSISDELRYQLLKKIADNPEASQRELAKMIGISVGKTNYCMRALINAGLIKAGNFSRSRRKLNYIYILTPKGITEKTAVTLRFLRFKQIEFKKLEKEIKRLKREATNLDKKAVD